MTMVTEHARLKVTDSNANIDTPGPSSETGALKCNRCFVIVKHALGLQSGNVLRFYVFDHAQWRHCAVAVTINLLTTIC